ncbi:flagellar biosynthesis protein FlhB [Vibrio sp. HA2012]|uniref:flagellar biosynthesis protein FlhB n=1 Tax=Vibrio sp. HA2012 TaxID=1971595 RepID=UPI000C2C19C1|nr:flagellar biosynthesis protein FlhB [Vibrio sp. HA2012]PJC86433.1 flagellar biosynthesis protein FlhB [Vibrio sp. HA2012]
MSNQSAQDKTEKASPQKIKKARKEGQVPRAKELTTALVFIGVMFFFYFYTENIWQKLAGVFRLNMSLTASDLDNPWQTIEHLGNCLGMIIELLLPLFSIILIIAVASSMVLGGWLFHLAGVFPKLSKLNPLSGLKRMFSTRSLVELIKSALKVSVIFTLLYIYLQHHLVELLSMQSMPFREGVITILQILFNGVLMLGTILLLFGLIDIPYQRWEHMKQLKMTKQELKEEFKNSEGRPEIKQRIRQVQQQMARRKIERTVPDADVVIVNPTHYAVAIKYEPAIYDAPFVVAKGIDEVAMHIQKIARENQVEIVSSPPLTRSIYHTTQIEQAIPNQLYVAVAHILTYVLQLRASRKGQCQQPHPLPAFAIPKHLQH